MPILHSATSQSGSLRNFRIAGLGLLLGLFFATPPAVGARAVGLPLIYCAGVILAGLAVGLSLSYLFITFVIDEASPCATVPVVRHRPEYRIEKRPTSDSGRRLAEENGRLQDLAAERERRRDPRYGVVAEQRIIWNELLDLELQDIDERASRICDEARDST